MRILVTGQLGYIGTILTPMLLKHGHEVVGMDSDLYARCTFGDSSAIPSVPNIPKDVRDATVADLKGFDTVIHLAALSNDPLGNFNPPATDEINRGAAVRLAEISREAGVRHYIFSSTCSNYGVAGNDFLDETSPFNPYTPYAKAKVAAEQQIMPMNSDRFSVSITRSATVFGLSPRIRWDLVLNNLTAYAHCTGRIYMKSDGTPWRAIVHVEDVAAAFVAIAEAPREAVHGQAFNVGRTQENYRVREIAEIVLKTVPGSRIEYAPDARPDPRCYRVNCDRILKAIPSYQPHWTAEQAVRQVYEGIKRHGLTVEQFEGAHYARLPHVKQLIAEGKLNDRFRWI